MYYSNLVALDDSAIFTGRIFNSTIVYHVACCPWFTMVSFSQVP